MTPIYCSRGHANASENRFCSACGEKLLIGQPGIVLGERYRIERELGHGGFGRTYLAQDINRFNEPCVLKEFAPQIQGSYALEKSEELFEREAGVLYQLNHPQIPRFRELFRAALEGRDRLFLVQDYVEGRTYSQLLEARRRQGICFSEIEVWQLLTQILPVLHYLHSAGVIHRDISPDNLILRVVDQLPVLIDFGGVKQVAATATSKYTSSAETIAPITRLGKLGYAPEEQMQGIVSPQTDLYALAVTALVLLTGKEPVELLDQRNHADAWQQMISLNPDLTAVLTRMLSPQPNQRFASAQAVLEALQPHSTPASASPTPSSSPDTSAPAFPSPPAASSLSTNVTHKVSPVSPSLVSAAAKRSSNWLKPLLFLLVFLVLIGGGWWWREQWLPLLSQLLTPTEPIQPTQPSALEKRAQAAGVNFAFLVELANATFYERYPDQAGRTLSDKEEDAALRQSWANIADEWLNLLQQNFSAETRRKLGSYTNADRNQWKQIINQLYISSRSLYDLTDAKFFHLFPDQRGKDFLNRPIGQVWQATAADQIQALQNGKTLEQIEFKAGAFSAQKSGSLTVGAGRVYTANLATGQIMRLNLQAPANSTLLSIYLPRPTKELSVLIEDSAEVTWTGTLPQSGYYEVVVVNTAAQPISYQLNLAVDNVTSTPIQPQQGEAPEAKD